MCIKIYLLRRNTATGRYSGNAPTANFEEKEHKMNLAEVQMFEVPVFAPILMLIIGFVLGTYYGKNRKG